MTIENNIKAVYRDGEPLSSYETILRGVSGEVYIPVDELEQGDKVTLVTQNEDKSEDGYRESLYLSTRNDRQFRNLSLEAEVEFVSDSNTPQQWVEFIVRGVSVWNNSFTMDECYIFGYRKGEFYFGKRGYHEEGERSYPYKQLFDLTTQNDDTRRFYSTLSDEHQETLQLKGSTLDYNISYLMKCEIIDNKVSMKVRNIAKKLTQTQDYEWVTLFEDIDIQQSVDDVVNLNVNLDESISVFEPFSTIDEVGFYGFSVPNSHFLMKRFEVVCLDENKKQRFYTDEEFSREISTNFCLGFNDLESTSMNAVKVGEEESENTEEFISLEGDSIPLTVSLDANDVIDIEIGNADIKKDDLFEDLKLEIDPTINNIHTNNQIDCFVDLDQTDSLGQEEIFFDFKEETDGSSEEYDIPDEVWEVLGKYPNSKVGGLIIETDSNLILNDVDVVGVQEDISKFIDRTKLNKLFIGRNFFMETDIRGTGRTIEMGRFYENKFKFRIDDQFLNTSPTFDAIWKYNLANFINQLIFDFIEYAVSGGVSAFNNFMSDLNNIIGDIDMNDQEGLELAALELQQAFTIKHGVSIGEAVVNIPGDLLEYMINAGVSPAFNVSNDNLDEVVRENITAGVDVNSIRTFAEFMERNNFQEILDLVRYGKQKSGTFDSFLTAFITKYNVPAYEAYLDFRRLWLRDAEKNMVISATGIEDRIFYQSVNADEYVIQDKKIIFKTIPRVGKKIKLRVFYDASFTVTNSYDKVNTVFEVPDEVKALYTETQNEKGVKKLVEQLDDTKFHMTVYDNIPFVVVPKKYNEYNDPLSIDARFCFPYLTENDTVYKNTLIPLRKVNELLQNDFESSRYGEIFPDTQEQTIGERVVYCLTYPTSAGYVEECFFYRTDRDCLESEYLASEVYDISAYERSEVGEVSKEWSREVDTLDTRSEFISGYWRDIKDIQGNSYPEEFLFSTCVSNVSGGTPLLPPFSDSILEGISSSPIFEICYPRVINVSGLDEYVYGDEVNDVYYKPYERNIFYPLVNDIDEEKWNVNETAQISSEVSIQQAITGQPVFEYYNGVSNQAKQEFYDEYYHQFDGVPNQDEVFEYYMYYFLGQPSISGDGLLKPKTTSEDGFNVCIVDKTNFPDNSFSQYVLPSDSFGEWVSNYGYELSDDVYDLEDADPNIASDKIVDKILDASRWFNLSQSKLGPYYREVLSKIVEVKSQNRYYGSKKDLASDATPFNLNNWLDGFYSGRQMPFLDLFTEPLSRYEFTEDGRLRYLSDDDYEYRNLKSKRDYIEDDNYVDPYPGVDDQEVTRVFANQDGNMPITVAKDYAWCTIVFDDIPHIERIGIYMVQGGLTFDGSLDGLHFDLDVFGYTSYDFDNMGGGLQSQNPPSTSVRVNLRYKYYRIRRTSFAGINIRHIVMYSTDGVDVSNLGKVSEADASFDYGVHFGRYYGNPWGVNNSRKQIIEQLRDTLDGKFEDYDLYYGDLTNLFYSNKTIEEGLKSNAIDRNIYYEDVCPYVDPISLEAGSMGIPDTNTYNYIFNKYVDGNTKYYRFDRDVIINSQVIFSADDFSNVTNPRNNYYLENALSVSRDNTEITYKNVVKDLQQGRDVLWKFNSNYFIKPSMLGQIPVGAVISVEYEYTMSYVTENENTPTRIAQRVVLGRVTGDVNQRFKNPEKIINRENVEYLNVHRFWIDNIQVDDFKINQVANDEYEIVMNIPEELKGNKDVSLSYKQDSYYELKEENEVTELFERGENVPWFWNVYTRDENGYIRKVNSFKGFVTDNDKFPKDIVYHLSENMRLDQVKTSDVGFGGQLVKPVQFGADNEDVMQLTTLKRKNNFEINFDFIYDADIERQLMRFDIIFKALSTKVKGIQQVTSYYALIFGLDKGISLVSRKIEAGGAVEEVVLAQIQDIGAVLKRDIFYSLKIEVVRSNVKVYFGERGGESKFYIGTNLNSGHDASNEELVASDKFDGLNVIYNDPTYFVDGDRIGLRAQTYKVNFANFKMKFYDPSNLTFGDPFKINNFDLLVSNLKAKFSIEGDLVAIKKIETGFEYVHIGDSLLTRRNDGDFVLHNMFVERIETHKDKCYVQEKVSSDSPMTVINVYENGFKLAQNIIVNGKHITNEPLISFLAVANKKATNIEKIDGKVFITIDEITAVEDDWSDLTATWDEYYAPWNLY